MKYQGINRNKYGDFSKKQCTRAAKQLWEFVFPDTPWPVGLVVYWDKQLRGTKKRRNTILLGQVRRPGGVVQSYRRHDDYDPFFSLSERISKSPWHHTTRIRLNYQYFTRMGSQFYRGLERQDCGWPFGPWGTVIHEFVHVLLPKGEGHSPRFHRKLRKTLRGVLDQHINVQMDQRQAA
jgi:hypothetical protein